MAIIISLRKMIKGTAGRIFMGLLFLAMFGGIGLSRIILKFFKGDTFEGIALVNGKEISRQLFQKAVAQEDRQLSAIRQQYGKNADLYMKVMGINANPHITALNRLLYTTLLDQFAQKMNINIAHGYLEARLADPRFLMEEMGEFLPQEVFTKDGNINIYAALEFLKSTGQMPAIENQLEDKLTKQFALLMLQSGFFVPSYAIKQLYIEQKLAKKFSYQTFSLDTFLATEKTKAISDEQLKAFYNEQNTMARRYWSPEKRDASIFTFTPTDYGIVVDQSELEQYYNKNKATRFVKEPLQIKVREIVFDDVSGKGLKTLEEEAHKVHALLTQKSMTFEDAAKEYSAHKKTGANGGLVDFFKRGTHEKEYERAAFKLKEKGDISPVTPVEKGFVILQKVDRKDATFESFDAVKKEIEKLVMEQKFKAEFVRQAGQLSRQEDPQEALAAFIAAHNGVKTTMKNIKRETDDQLEARLFALKKEGDFAPFISNGKGIIVQCDTKTKTAQSPFEAVKSKVFDDYCEAKATQALEAAVQKAKDTALATHGLKPVDGGKLGSTKFITMDDEKEMKALADIGFPEQSFGLDWPGAVLSSFTPKTGIVVKLDEIEKIEEQAFTEKKPELLAATFERNSALFSNGFIASLFRTATIKVDDSIARMKDQ